MMNDIVCFICSYFAVDDKMSNFFVAMKKSVHSKSNKEKYEQTESEMKVMNIFH